MSAGGRRLAWAVAAGALVALSLVARGPAASPGASSSLALGPLGLRAFREYAERRGVEARLRDLPYHADAAQAGAAELLVFPLARALGDGEIDALARFVRDGGELVVGVQGERPGRRPSRSGASERELLQVFRLRSRSVRGEPPLWPARWREWAGAEWLTRPEGRGPFSKDRLRIAAPTQVVEAPPEAEVYQRGPDGEALVFRFRHGRGRVVVLPADALSNRRLAVEGNAELAEALLAELPGRWVFDEYHHGLARPLAHTDSRARRTLELLAGHAVFLYLAAILAVSRRFGPPWAEPIVRGGSTASFLRALGDRHQRLRHHAAAATALVERARALDPRLDAVGFANPAQVTSADGFVDLARAVAAAQAEAHLHGRT